ncbi:olfactory receptor 14I1-like [Trachemys scripta elegans]|uniref:olfactory receptor 14I1-like n=1 Tax=Trachemys scripta elegans TaxID=31138 RepID=UPI001556E826|nr:olfactory receptor 14I1-like [Trachemys scripta elegans]
MSNQTTRSEFLLLGFSDVRELQILHFTVFLVIYLAALMGNLLVITVITLNRHLHTPMYFFLSNLSILDLCYISVTVPKSMANSLTNTRRISFSGCVTQVFLVVCFAAAEMAFLTVMAYDRYVAICLPLRYREIMNRSACVQMAAGCWVSSTIYSLFLTVDTFRLHFCESSVIGQFFCDIPQLLKVSCTNIHDHEILLLVCCSVFGSMFIISIFVSYIHIFSTVLRIPSAHGRYKALSTCLPHLIVFSLFMSTTMFTYMRPKAMSSLYLDLLAAVFYSVMPPLLNPIIYSLRNKAIKHALWEMTGRIFCMKKN